MINERLAEKTFGDIKLRLEGAEHFRLLLGGKKQTELEKLEAIMESDRPFSGIYARSEDFIGPEDAASLLAKVSGVRERFLEGDKKIAFGKEVLKVNKLRQDQVGFDEEAMADLYFYFPPDKNYSLHANAGSGENKYGIPLTMLGFTSQEPDKIIGFSFTARYDFTINIRFLRGHDQASLEYLIGTEVEKMTKEEQIIINHYLDFLEKEDL